LFISSTAACRCSGGSEAIQCAENGGSELFNSDLDRGVGLLVLGVEEAEMATELVECAEFVVELELDPFDRLQAH
jgi:hypothetical protein